MNAEAPAAVTETPSLAPVEVAALVTKRAELRAAQTRLDDEKATLEKEVQAINRQLIGFGPGTYRGAGDSRVIVISPKPSVQLPPAGKENKELAVKIKEIIAGQCNTPEEDAALFKKMFWFVGGYVLCRDFRPVSAALLTPARLQKVLALLEVAGKPYVR